MDSSNKTPVRSEDEVGTTPRQISRIGRRTPWWLPVGAAVAVLAAGGVVVWNGGTIWQPRDARQDEAARPGGNARHGAGSAQDAEPKIEALRQEALGVAASLVEEFPDAFDAMCMRGLVYSRYGDRAAAVECWKRALKRNPGFATAQYCLSRIALECGEYEESLKWSRAALQLDPQMPDAPLLSARALMGLGRMEEALAALEEHLRLAPASAEGQAALGQVYLSLGQWEKAKRRFNAAIESNPNWPRAFTAYYGLATACQRLGQVEQAEHFRDEFQKRKAEDQRLRKERDRGYDDLASARRSAADVHVDAGKVYFAHGSLERAEKHWSEAAQLDPSHLEPRQALVSLYQQQDAPTKAIPLLEQLSRIEPNNPVNHVNLGVVSARLGRLDEAEDAYRRVVELAPDNPVGYVALAQLYLRTERNPAEAKTLAATAVGLQPIASNYFLLGTACKRNDDRAGALTALKRAMDLDPGNSAYRAAYAEISEKK